MLGKNRRVRLIVLALCTAMANRSMAHTGRLQGWPALFPAQQVRAGDTAARLTTLHSQRYDADQPLQNRRDCGNACILPLVPNRFCKQA